jgi:hypothetical protein
LFTDAHSIVILRFIDVLSDVLSDVLRSPHVGSQEQSV